MLYRNLGNTGMKVSVLGFGNWVTSHNPDQAKTTEECVVRCVEEGINFFDTAEIYGFGEAERIFGDIFAKHAWPRDKLVISTKFIRSGPGINDGGLSRKHIVEGVKASLKRLKMDYVDVILAHRPDFDTPMEETVRAMNWVIQNGLAFYWGTSEWSAAMIQEACGEAERLGLIGPVVEQPQYNMLVRDKFEKEYAYLFDKHRMGSTVWSPLASGILTGKYNDGNIAAGGRFDTSDPMMKMVLSRYFSEDKKEATVKILGGLGEIAKEMDCTQAQLALAWTVANTDVSTAILGASRVGQIESNVKALDVLKKWTPELDKRLEDLLKNEPRGELDWRGMGLGKNHRG